MEHLSLTALNEIIKGALTTNLSPSYWVVAEIGEIRLNANGHCYLELVDKFDNAVSAKSKATIWSYTFRNLNGWFEAITGSPLMQGMRILANVQVSFHEIYGLSLNIKDIDAHFTIGDRERKKRETIARLVADGVFDMNRLNVLPDVPQRIAVVSSATAAGFEDFMHTISACPYNIHVTLFQSVMQGSQSPQSIITALHQAALGDFDLLLIIRGGGAQMDLDTFNDYDLCAHIAQYPIPVVTGIGHERDETIADMVAHTKLKTPTAVAEFIISAFELFHAQLHEQLHAVKANAKNVVVTASSKLQFLKHDLKYHTVEVCARYKRKLSEKKLGLSHSLEYGFEKKHSGIVQMASKLRQATQSALKDCNSNILMLKKSIALSDPSTILKKGYTITFANGKSIRGLDDIEKGDELITLTAHGSLFSTLTKKEFKHVEKRT